MPILFSVFRSYTYKSNHFKPDACLVVHSSLYSSLSSLRNWFLLSPFLSVLHLGSVLRYQVVSKSSWNNASKLFLPSRYLKSLDSLHFLYSIVILNHLEDLLTAFGECLVLFCFTVSAGLVQAWTNTGSRAIGGGWGARLLNSVYLKHERKWMNNSCSFISLLLLENLYSVMEDQLWGLGSIVLTCYLCLKND